MPKSKPVLRAVRVSSSGLDLCTGCYFHTPEGFTCNGGDESLGTLAPAQCCNFNGNGESVIFREMAREPIRNPA